jgi:hypothetical protein
MRAFYISGFSGRYALLRRSRHERHFGTLANGMAGT